MVNKFFKVDTVNFLKRIYKNCSSLKLDKKTRINEEAAKLDDIRFENLQQLEREFHGQKKGLFKGGATKEYEAKKRAIEDEYNNAYDELEKNITALIAADTKMVGKNMKLYERIDKILRENVMCFQAK